MKKILFTIYFLITLAGAFAQTINFGVKAGVNLSKFAHGSSSPYNNSILTGFSAGGIIDIGFNDLSVQSGIFYSIKGEKDQVLYPPLGGSPMQYLSSEILFNYIEMPINFLYKSKINRHTIFHWGGGPYFGYGIAQTITINNKIFADPNFGHKFTYNNPDYGLNLIAGLEVKNRYMFDADYGLGLANLASNGFIFKNRIISLSLGYMFR